MTTADRFRAFAEAAGAGGSPLYETLAGGIAGDDEILRLVERAKASQRQPVLVLAVCRLLGAPISSYAGLRDWMLAHAEPFLIELDRRLTQTNDVRRVGPIALALSLASVESPISLLEVGASAGLGLYPDRYAIDVTAPGRVPSRLLGDPDSGVRLEMAIEGESPFSPSAEESAMLPVIGHRAGLDLAPLDVRLATDALWLETLLWPGQTERVGLLRAAIEIARRDPARIVEGDAVDGLQALVDTAPTGTIPVVVTAGTLVYLEGRRRQEFVDLVERLGVRWISYEKTGLLTGIHATLPSGVAAEPGRHDFATLALDGRALAVGDAHGTRLTWL